jgi:hypothetical protein
MKANELRIGNYVNYEQTTHIITSVNMDYSISVWIDINNKEHLYPHKNSELKPIPLTEEWLLRFGWGKGEYDSEYIDNISLKQEVLSYNLNANMFCIETNCDIMEISHINYVHQLQNLYFALTNEELKLKQ